MKKPLTTLTQVTHEEREIELKPLDFAIIRRLTGYMAKYRARRNLLLAIVTVRSIQLPTLAWAIGAVIGGPVSRLDTTGIVLGTLGYALLAALTQFTMHYRSLIALELGENIIYDLRNQMFRHLQTLPMRFFHKTRVGRIISRFTSDTEAVRVGVQDVLFVSMVQTGQMLVSAALMLWYDWALFTVVLGMAPILWLMNRHFRKRMSQAWRAVQESFSRITATLLESVGGIRVTQGFVRQDVNAGMFHDLVTDHYQYNLDAAKAGGVFVPMLEFNSQLFTGLVLLIGGWRVFHGHAQVEDLYQFVLLTNMFFGPISALGTQYNQALAAMAGAERVFTLLDTTPEWTDAPGAAPIPPINGRVEFDRVTFGYDPGRPVLHEVSFVAESGQTVALVGHTGSGKSTIVNLISKFYLPWSGRVMIDGINLLDVTSDSLHRQMGNVLQQNFLFTGSVVDNIRVGKPDATMEEIVAAADALDCRDLLELLPDGFATVVGEKGSGISLGQRQLICFTRAMLAAPRILILDEATCSVDTMTEARIQKALSTLLRGRTSFVVAHRLSTIRHADQVLVMEDGRITERGTHEELLVQGGIYTDLYRQFIKTAEA